LGIPSHLTIVGCTPPEQLNHKNIKVIPFLNKNKQDEREELYRLYYHSHFFILPTRAECFSIALCESNAFGLPALSTDTGGIPELVHNGVNGFLLPLAARGNQYAAQVATIFGDHQKYKKLRGSSRDEFDSRLNWDAWAAGVSKALHNAVRSSDDGGQRATVV
jgi:glycosyltransferase involved in cell wall biosynthesis